MADIKEIKTLLKEAQLYQNQGLLKEARKRYESAEEMVEGDASLPGCAQLLEGIRRKVASLDAVTYRVEKKTHITEISPRDKDLIKRLFSGGATDDADTSALEGAVALAKFGQFDRAISEFEDLLEGSPLRIVAAKHILRCHMALRTLHDPLLQFQKWVTTGYFEREELSELSLFLERTYGLSVNESAGGGQGEKPRAEEPQSIGSSPKENKEQEKVPDFDPYVDEYVDVLGGFESRKNDKGAASSSGSGEEYMDVIGAPGKKKPAARYNDIMATLDDYVDYISSVGIPLEGGETATIPVNLQTGSVANLIISGDRKKVIEKMKKGARLEKVRLNSPISVNVGNCTVMSVARIDMGPKRGDYSVDLKIEA